MRVCVYLLLGFCLLAQAKTRVEILADANYPPYSWQEGGGGQGDLCRYYPRGDHPHE